MMGSTPMPDVLKFELLKTSAEQLAPRLGNLLTRSGGTINTPHYIANTSRGLVPHLSQDMLIKNTQLQGVYLAIEDRT